MRRPPGRYRAVLLAIAFAVASSASFAQTEEYPLLTKSKTNYNQQLTQIWDETDKKIAVLNHGYPEKLAAAERSLQQAGNLDGILQVRKEQERFRTSQNVTGDDVQIFPEALTTVQRDYVKARAALENERNTRARQLAKQFLEYLDKLKRDLTQQNKVEAALQVHQEQDRVKASLGLATSEEVKEPANPPPAESRELTSDTGLLHPSYKPPVGYVWIFVTDKGFPVKEITLLVQDKSSRKLTDYLTDSTGRISFQADPEQTFRIMVVSEGWGMQEVVAAKPGNAYWFKLARPASGVACCTRVRDNSFTLPEIGRINFNGTWSSSTGETGPVLRTTDGDARFGSGRNNQEWLHAHPEVTYTVTKGKTSYELRMIKLTSTGNQYLIVYKKQ